jgi:hypothetical protein
MIYFKLKGEEKEAKTFDPYCTYYCKDVEGNEWEIKRTPLGWTATFKGKIVTCNSLVNLEPDIAGVFS